MHIGKILVYDNLILYKLQLYPCILSKIGRTTMIDNNILEIKGAAIQVLLFTITIGVN